MTERQLIDKSDAADAKRLRWMLSGHGYFEEKVIIGCQERSDQEQDEARRLFDEAMAEERLRAQDERRATYTLEEVAAVHARRPFKPPDPSDPEASEVAPRPVGPTPCLTTEVSQDVLKDCK